MNSNLISIMQIIFLFMCFTSILSCAIYSYARLKHKTKENIIKNVVIQWIEFIRMLAPEKYIVYQKYGIWRYVECFKIEMMF